MGDGFREVGDQTTRRVLLFVERLTSTLFFLVLLLELTNLGLRVIGKGIPQSTEIGGMTVFLLCFLGMARGFEKGAHVRFSWLSRRLSPSRAAVLDGIAWTLCLVTLTVLLVWGAMTTVKFYSLYLPLVSMPWFPTWLTMGAIPLGSALSIAGVVLYLRDRRRAAAR